MKATWAQLFSSKRFLLIIIGLIAIPLARVGINVDTEAMAGMVSLIVTGVLGYSMKDTETKTPAAPQPAAPPVDRKPEAGIALHSVLFAIAVAGSGLLLAMNIASCGATKAGAKAAAGTFEVCAGDAVRRAVDQLEPDLRPMLVAAAALERPDLTKLRERTAGLTEDVRRCAVMAIAAGVAAFIAAAPKTMAQQVAPARVLAVARELVGDKPVAIDPALLTTGGAP